MALSDKFTSYEKKKLDDLMVETWGKKYKKSKRRKK